MGREDRVFISMNRRTSAHTFAAALFAILLSLCVSPPSSQAQLPVKSPTTTYPATKTSPTTVTVPPTTTPSTMTPVRQPIILTPKITSVTPETCVRVGTQVTLIGVNFGYPKPSDYEVGVMNSNGAITTLVASDWSAASIIFKVPSGAGLAANNPFTAGILSKGTFLASKQLTMCSLALTPKIDTSLATNLRVPSGIRQVQAPGGSGIDSPPASDEGADGQTSTAASSDSGSDNWDYSGSGSTSWDYPSSDSGLGEDLGSPSGAGLSAPSAKRLGPGALDVQVETTPSQDEPPSQSEAAARPAIGGKVIAMRALAKRGLRKVNTECDLLDLHCPVCRKDDSVCFEKERDNDDGSSVWIVTSKPGAKALDGKSPYDAGDAGEDVEAVTGLQCDAAADGAAAPFALTCR